MLPRAPEAPGMAPPGLLHPKPSALPSDKAPFTTGRVLAPAQLLQPARKVLGNKRRRVSTHQLKVPVPRVSTLTSSPGSNTSASALVDELLQEIKGTGK